MLLDPQFFTLAKAIHMITVTLTIAGFVVRSIWMLQGLTVAAHPGHENIPACKRHGAPEQRSVDSRHPWSVSIR